MSREWKPGDIAKVRADAIALLDELIDWWPSKDRPRPNGGGPGMAGGTAHLNFARDLLVGDGPLVVIDPEDRDQVERLMSLHCEDIITGRIFGALVTQMQDALRAFANPTPPKPDEPLGLGAVVVDDGQILWVRINDTHWHSEAYPNNRQTWAELDIVEVLSDGFRTPADDEPVADWERDLLRGAL